MRPSALERKESPLQGPFEQNIMSHLDLNHHRNAALREKIELARKEFEAQREILRQRSGKKLLPKIERGKSTGKLRRRKKHKDIHIKRTLQNYYILDLWYKLDHFWPHLYGTSKTPKGR